MATTPNRYHPLLIGTHWLTLALLVAVYALIEMRGIFPKGSDARELMKTWHFMLGLSVFALVLVRLPLRLALGAPPIAPAPPPWQHRVALAMDAALYAILLVLPLLGWLALSAKGAAIPFFGAELPPLVAPDKALAKSLEKVHETLGTLGYWLIGVHAGAALVHHHLMHDDTLRRMWPRRPAAGRRRIQGPRPF